MALSREEWEKLQGEQKPYQADIGSILGQALMTALPGVIGGLVGGKAAAGAGLSKGAEIGSQFQETQKQETEKQNALNRQFGQYLVGELSKEEADKRAREKEIEIARLKGDIDRKNKEIEVAGALKKAGFESAQKVASEKSKQEDDLRKELAGRDDIKTAFTATAALDASRNAIQQLRQSQELEAQGKPGIYNPANDQLLVVNAAKALDPGSVVREGEAAAIQKLAPTLEKLGFSIDRIMKGGSLTPEQRERLLEMTERAVEPRTKQYSKSLDEYKSLAQARGLDPSKVLIGTISTTQPLEGASAFKQGLQNRQSEKIAQQIFPQGQQPNASIAPRPGDAIAAPQVQTYSQGQIVSGRGGKKYEFVGGDPRDPKNYKLVQ